MRQSSYVLLVGVQFDGSGEAAWQEALRIAGHREGVAIHLAHVVDEREVPGITEMYLQDRKRALDQAAENLQVFALDKAGTAANPSRVPVRLHVSIGDVAQRLVEYAREEQADAVVIGSNLNRDLLGVEHGWVASELARTIPCSLIIARPKAYENELRPVSIEPDPFPASEEPSPDSGDRVSFPFGLEYVRRT